MEHIYSQPLERHEYDKFGFCQDPRYVPRRHKDQHLARAGSRDAKTDCEALIGPYPRPTCESAVGHSIAMVMPECLPARLETMGYFMEALFHMDNMAESGSQDETGRLANEWAETMRGPGGGESGDEPGDETDATHPTSRTGTGAKQVVAKLALQLLLVDPTCAQNVLAAWREWARGFSRPRRFASVDEYMAYRVVDSGAIVAVHLMNWAMGLDVSAEELREVDEIVGRAARALACQNDFFSFDYEHDMFVELGRSSLGIANAVFVLAETEGLGLPEARERVAQLARGHEDAVLRLRGECWGRVGHKLRVCLDGIVDMVVGNLVWSASCDRYSSHRRARRDMDVALVVRPVVVAVAVAAAKGEGEGEGEGERERERERKEAAAAVAVQRRLEGPPTPPHDSDQEDDGGESAGERKRRGRPSVPPAPASSSSSSSSSSPAVPSAVVLGDEIVSAPIRYLESLPSKGFREAIVDGMDGWLRLPARSVSIIKDVVRHVHTASLLCDDMEDSSPLRRGQPSAHTIFGAPQTVNATSYLWTLALDRLSGLRSPRCLRVFVDEVRRMQVGQSWDLHWTAALQCPSEDEYLAMVDMKTGGLFALLVRLMVAESPRNSEMPDFDDLVRLTGRYFQIRDDLANLTSEEYASQKGWCEDLDEGKYSLPLIHALDKLQGAARVQLQALLVQRRTAGAMTVEMKRLVIDHLKGAGSLDYARALVLELQDAVGRELARLEAAFGQENYVMQLALERLRMKA